MLHAGDLVRSPLLIAVILSATSLGIAPPALKDSGAIDMSVRQLVIAGASVGEVVPIVLLSLLFFERSPGITAQLALLVAFLFLVAAVTATIFGIERSRRIFDALLALQDTTS